MSFKKEMLAFKERVDQFVFDQRAKDEAIQQYQKLLDKREEQIQALLDRLMSRNLPELKTFSLPEAEKTATYDPFADEGLAGEIVEMEGKSEPE